MMAANDYTRDHSGSGARSAHRRAQAQKRGDAGPRPARVELRIDTLVLPHSGNEQAVGQALLSALRDELAERLADGLPRPAARREVTLALRDPLPPDAPGMGIQLAAAVIRAVLP